MNKYICMIIVITCSITALAAATKPTPADIEKGKTVFKTNCAVCHGDAGAGDGPAGKALKPPPRNFSKDSFKGGDKPEQIFETVTKGMKGTAMAAFGHLSEADRWAVTHFVGTLRPKK